jgi:hypothetical protein
LTNWFKNYVQGWWRVATVKGLEGVDQRLLDKLEGAGVLSVSDLATSTASELLEEYYLTMITVAEALI